MRPIYRDPSNQVDGSSSSASYTVLFDKYKALCSKYESLVGKLQSDTAERSSVYQLAWWAMRTLSSAIALIRSGTLLMSNARWHELDARDPSNSWRTPADAPGPQRTYLGLNELASREGAHLSEEGPFAVIVVEHPATGQMLEVQLERIERPAVAALVVAIAHDVTARTRSERELEKARQALAHQGRIRATGELAAGIAHDLNNVLGALVLRVSLLQADARCMEAQGQNIEAIARTLKDATARVGRLHELARSPREVPLQAIELGATICEAVEMVRAEVEDKASFAGAPIRIVTDVADLPHVPAMTAADVRHMFINLLLNARDAMKANGGMIRIEGKRGSGAVVVTVADEGTGIPEEHLERVCDPFFTTKGDRGTGLGLSNARDVMAALGGTIEVANRPSRGAVITLSFPITVERLSPKAPKSVKAAPGQRVLLIDDDQDQLLIAKAVIEMDEQEVDVAASGEEALARLRSGSAYDLVLCDAGMPGMNGLQAAEEIQKIAPGTRVYLLTGWDLQMAEDDPRCAFVSGVLQKPMNLDRLRAILAPSSRE